jgi:predicted MFS family arabinose efflux permease
LPASLLKDAEFLKLWTGETISLVGSQFSNVAIPILAVDSLGATSFQLGMINALALLAFPLFGLFVGVWADRHRKRVTMIAADVGRMFFLGLVPISAIFFSVDISLLYVVVFAVGTLQTFFDISYQAYLPHLVESDQLVEGNSRLETSRSAATMLGPTLAGFAVHLFGAPVAIFGDVLGYLGSATFLSRIKRRESVPPPKRTAIRHDIREGLQVIFKSRNLTSIALCTGTYNLFNNAFTVVATILMLRTFGFSAIALGVVFAGGGVGSVLAAVTALRVVGRLGIGRSITIGILVSGFPFIFFYWATAQSALAIATAAFFFAGLGGVIYNVAQVSYRQALVPLDLQGRMNASMRVLVWGPIPAGAFLGGVMGTLIGVSPTILITAVGTSLAFLWVLLSPVRSVKGVPTRGVLVPPPGGPATGPETSEAMPR